jgi:hypothetical protein
MANNWKEPHKLVIGIWYFSICIESFSGPSWISTSCGITSTLDLVQLENNTWIVDNQGLFIYINTRYMGSYHNVTILWHYDIYTNWCNHFTHTIENFKYLLGDSIYMGEKMFIMWWIGGCKLSWDAHPWGMVNAYYSMHVGYKVKLKWDIFFDLSQEIKDSMLEHLCKNNYCVLDFQFNMKNCIHWNYIALQLLCNYPPRNTRN